MGETTKNIKLVKPVVEDFYDIGVQNGNMDKIDEEIGKLEKPEYEAANEVSQLQSGESIFTGFGKLSKAVSALISHMKVAGTMEAAGHVQLTNSTGSTSTTTAATPAAVKSAYDKAGEALPKVNVSSSNTVTAAGTYALDAVQANASVSGTLANKIAEGSTNINAHAQKAGTTASVGHVQLTDSVNSTSTTTAAVPASVKAAYDKAAAALPKANVSSSNSITSPGIYALDAVQANASVSGTLANQIEQQNTNLETLWGDGKITMGGTANNMNPSHFSGVAATWRKIGRLVILQYCCQRISGGDITAFAIRGIPPAQERNEITWNNVIGSSAYPAYGYLESDCISFYGRDLTSEGYYRGDIIYLSRP